MRVRIKLLDAITDCWHIMILADDASLTYTLHLNGGRGGHAFVSLLQGPYVSPTSGEAQCCGLGLPQRRCTSALIFCVKAENFIPKNLCSQPLHLEPVNSTDPVLDNGTGLSNINHLIEASGKSF